MNQRMAILCLCIILFPRVMSGQISWTKHTLTDNFDGACSVHAQDINGDSLTDVVAAASTANSIALWTNNGGSPPTWTQQTIDNTFVGACFVYVEDVDGDSDMDVLGSAWYGHTLAWRENGGGNPIQWTRHDIALGFYNGHEITAVDMDDDNDIDVLGAAALTNEIAWFENDGMYPPNWTRHTISNNCGGARSVKGVYIDADSLIDVVGAGFTTDEITWWRNNGDTTWTEYVIDSTFDGSHMVYAFDIDSDGDTDVVGAAYMASDITWWRNDGGAPIQWTEQTIDGYFLGALGVFVKDINNDGHLDVLGTADIPDDVAWWSNDGNSPISWSEQIIDGNCQGAWPVYAEDIDNDGDIDVLAAANAVDDIYWYESDLVGITEGDAPYITANEFSATIVRGPMNIPTGKNVKIYDIAGRNISSQQIAPGIYFIEIDGNIANKIIKIR